MFAWVQKTQFCFENVSAGTYHIGEKPKKYTSFEIPKSCNSLLSNNTKFFSFVYVSLNAFQLYQEMRRKIFCFRSVSHSLDRPEKHKKAINFKNTFFSLITCSICLIKQPIKKFQLLANHYPQNLLILCFSSET